MHSANPGRELAAGQRATGEGPLVSGQPCLPLSKARPLDLLFPPPDCSSLACLQPLPRSQLSALTSWLKAAGPSSQPVTPFQFAAQNLLMVLLLIVPKPGLTAQERRFRESRAWFSALPQSQLQGPVLVNE